MKNNDLAKGQKDLKDQKDLRDTKGPGFSRRHLLEMVGFGAIGVTTVGFGALATQFLAPNVLLEPPTVFKAGSPDLYSPNSVTVDKEQKVYIVRAREGYFYAMAAVCTHLGCITNYKADTREIACPCHGSRFDLEGNVVHGPAPHPLPRYSVRINEGGVLVVDKGTIVGPADILKV